MIESKLLIIHRKYRHKGGEDVFLHEVLAPTLKKLNISYEICELPPLFSNFFKGCLEVVFMLLGLEKLRPSFFTLKKRTVSKKTTHVLFNNFIPTISLAAPRFFKQQGLRTLYWLHNARLSCANGLLFNGREKCHRCLSQGSHWAALQNCHKNLIQSIIYSIVYQRQRVAKKIFSFIDMFICNSDFTARNLNEAAIQLKQEINHTVLRFSPPTPIDNKTQQLHVQKPFYLFLGRVSHEKGADIFVELATKYVDKNFVVAGDGPLLKSLKNHQQKNVIFLGHVNGEKEWLLKNAEALIVPSRVPETSSLVIAEAAFYKTPVVYPKGGGAEETFLTYKCTGSSLDAFSGQNFEKSSETAMTSQKIRSVFEEEISKILSENL